jgi:hypothetical protein
MRRRALVLPLAVAGVVLAAAPSPAAPHVPTPLPTFVAASASTGTGRTAVGVTVGAISRFLHTWDQPPAGVCLYATGGTTWRGAYAEFTEQSAPVDQLCVAPLEGAHYGFDPVTWDARLVATVPTVVRYTRTHGTGSVGYVETLGVRSGRATVSLTFRNADVPCRLPVSLLFFIVPVPAPDEGIGRCAAVSGQVQLAGRRSAVPFAPQPIVDTTDLLTNHLFDRAVVGVAGRP